MLNRKNIWCYAQNKPTLIAKDEEIFINIVRKRKMSNDKIQCYVEKWEEIYADEKDKFDALLSEYINAKAEQGHTIKESLLDLYKKGIIAKGVVKEKAKLNEYEFLIALSENGIECSYLRISDEELKTIAEILADDMVDIVEGKIK